jgi:hypothetical protein
MYVIIAPGSRSLTRELPRFLQAPVPYGEYSYAVSAER